LLAFCLACSFSLALSSTHSLAGPHDPHSLDYVGYDDAIRSAAAKELPAGLDYRWWKAQLFAESGFDRFAVSPVGAQGLCQVMPPTRADWVRDWFPKNVWGDVSPFDARFCIIGGAKYLRQLIRFPDWLACELLEALRFGQGGYNAGPGNIRKARNATAAGCHWDAAAAGLVGVTGAANAKQTTDYVARIARLYRQLLALPAWITVPCIWTEHSGGCGHAF
jgi:soluble lytic murein transglycosylase-like protein